MRWSSGTAHLVVKSRRGLSALLLSCQGSETINIFMHSAMVTAIDRDVSRHLSGLQMSSVNLSGCLYIWIYLHVASSPVSFVSNAS
jgi:hypothetical protein